MELFLARLTLSGLRNQLFASSSEREAPLPPVMRKRLVRFRHAMYVFFLLDGSAATVSDIEQFIGQFVNHSLLAAVACISNDPADRQRGSTVDIDLNRYLVVGATDAPGFYFEQRLGILHHLLEQLQGLIAALRLQLRKSFIENTLGRGPLSLPHHRVDELGHQVRPIYCIGWNRPLCDMSFSWHLTP